FHDALDLLGRGAEWLRSITSRLAADSRFRTECVDRRVLRRVEELKLNPPVINPGKILAVGLNYAAHAAEQNIEPPASPLIFSKNVTALAGSGWPIRLPHISRMIDYEAELAFVIGREGRSIKADRAFDHIAGLTIMNDVTARDLQKGERQWARAKGLDTFAPCGPWLVTLDEIGDPHSLGIRLRVNGETRQDSNTSDMIFKIPELVEFISQDLTLKPGDIISTGTPSGVGVHRVPPLFLKSGDVIEIEIDRIGLLSNPVAQSGG
ncbi:MAG TPA: fumarylacetoacetate hydrolase family protein, partial [Blastocatellia bacterium]|nr:fumarylacetoacetate hydrolase family protein [Blastocatellia bacterium]